MKKAWLVRWGYHAQNETKLLKELGIKEKIIDVLSIRKKFNQIVEIAKDIYIRDILSFSEKVYLSNYILGEKRREELFKCSVPVFTHYHSNLYKKLCKKLEKAFSENNRIEIKKLQNKIRKCPEYITVGHNPYLEISKVFNLTVYFNNSDNEVIEWDTLLSNGDFERENYERRR